METQLSWHVQNLTWYDDYLSRKDNIHVDGPWVMGS